jgi:hypothetical protein
MTTKFGLREPGPAEKTWPVGEARVFERIKVRNSDGEHVENSFEEKEE